MGYGGREQEAATWGRTAATEKEEMVAVEQKPRSRIDAEQNKNKKRNPTPYPTAQIV